MRSSDETWFPVFYRPKSAFLEKRPRPVSRRVPSRGEILTKSFGKISKKTSDQTKEAKRRGQRCRAASRGITRRDEVFKENKIKSKKFQTVKLTFF
jgi:hypothetical protein